MEFRTEEGQTKKSGVLDFKIEAVKSLLNMIKDIKLAKSVHQKVLQDLGIGLEEEDSDEGNRYFRID